MNIAARVLAAHLAFLGSVGVGALQPPEPVAEPKPPEPLPTGAVVYHTLTGRDAQVIFTSDAPLEKIVGKSNAVVGYAIPGPAGEPAKLVSASWILPVRSLATGIPLRDEHMVGKEWLGAQDFPNIEFVLSRVEAVKEIKRGEGFTTWSATLVGDMTMHGVAREIRIDDARVSFFEASPRTQSIAPGHLIFLKCEYTVHLSQFNIQNSDVPKKVSDVVKLSQMLRLSSASPEEIERARKSKEAGASPKEADDSEVRVSPHS